MIYLTHLKSRIVLSKKSESGNSDLPPRLRGGLGWGGRTRVLTPCPLSASGEGELIELPSFFLGASSKLLPFQGRDQVVQTFARRVSDAVKPGNYGGAQASLPAVREHSARLLLKHRQEAGGPHAGCV